MFRRNNSSTAVPSFLDNQFQYNVDISNQLKLCGNVEFNSLEGGIGFFHKFRVYYPDNIMSVYLICYSPFVVAVPIEFHDETDRKASILNMNLVSTGLRLCYDDDERNSSITCASGSLMGSASSLFSALSNDMKREIDEQNKALDHLIRIQEEKMRKGVRDIRDKHMASFLAAVENEVAKKMQEKEVELERVAGKNKELMERVKHATWEAQKWCYMAKYNESVINVLRANLHKEGIGESDADSYTERDLVRVRCRSCGRNEASVLLMPCRHLCLCRECEAGVCPVCRAVTTASFEDVLLDWKCVELMHWDKRVAIIISIVKGLEYLEYSSDPPIVHSSN
ncbi:SBP (S-ribonuclease binding protein) family protein [Striga asiatica]|uniref:SBP (S-ribonuclease binding protein) family protein n=1 Tax=Striga asiatica TaxID=4170 RepID=A0A5A7PHX7_STRAF|nr:SBP (S-ribonuclease binding protein) family protein [Striga asiatica]